MQTRLRELGYAPTSRTKTTQVLVEKLRREQTRIRAVHDIAGARIVEDCSRDQQDEIAGRIVAAFNVAGERAPIVKDRRTTPSYGYRAVHVIVHVDGLPLEIQIRTHLQDMWAQIVESLGDRWGRGIRYGEGPPDPDQPDLGRHTRAMIWDLIQGMSDQIDRLEKSQKGIGDLDASIDQVLDRGVPSEAEHDELMARRTDLDDVKADRARVEEELKQNLRALAQWAALAKQGV